MIKVWCSEIGWYKEHLKMHKLAPNKYCKQTDNIKPCIKKKQLNRQSSEKEKGYLAESQELTRIVDNA